MTANKKAKFRLNILLIISFVAGIGLAVVKIGSDYGRALGSLHGSQSSFSDILFILCILMILFPIGFFVYSHKKIGYVLIVTILGLPLFFYSPLFTIILIFVVTVPVGLITYWKSRQIERMKQIADTRIDLPEG